MFWCAPKLLPAHPVLAGFGQLELIHPLASGFKKQREGKDYGANE
jgi:hypothetical protein